MDQLIRDGAYEVLYKLDVLIGKGAVVIAHSTLSLLLFAALTGIAISSRALRGYLTKKTPLILKICPDGRFLEVRHRVGSQIVSVVNPMGSVAAAH